MSKSTVERWENGSIIPRVDELSLVANACGVNLNWLQTGLGDPYAKGFERLKDSAWPTGETVRAMEREILGEDREPTRTGETVGGVIEHATPEGAVRVKVFRPGDFALIGLAEGVAGAGPGGVIWDSFVDYYPFKRSWLEKIGGGTEEKRSKFVLIKVAGDSMEPTINAGELALLNTNDNARTAIINDKIYALRNPDGDIIIKRLLISRASLTVMSDNHRRYQAYGLDLENLDLRKIIVGRLLWVGKEFL